MLINQRRVFRIKRGWFRCKRRLLVNKRRNITDKRHDIRVSSAQNFPSREPIPRPWQPSRRKSPVAAVCDRQTISKMQCFGGHRPPLQVWPPAFAEISEAVESISPGLVRGGPSGPDLCRENVPQNKSCSARFLARGSGRGCPQDR